MLNDEHLGLLQHYGRIALAQKVFWEYCKLREPGFYIDSRPHLKTLCDILNNFYLGLPMPDGKVHRKIIINEPPQHGKTRTLVNWFCWVFGINPDERIITASYNEIQSQKIGRFTRNAIRQESNIDEQIVHGDIFPGCEIQLGEANMRRWALKGQHFNFLATSPHGTSTGDGATIKAYDDMVKGKDEAVNPKHLDGIYEWIVGTMGSRNDPASQGDPLELYIGTPWAKDDPMERVKRDNPGAVYEVRMPAMKDGKMLCQDFLSREAYMDKRRIALKSPVTKAIFIANYDLERIDIAGRLYPHWKTYKKIPTDNIGREAWTRIGAYIDTADEGDDFLCMWIYGQYDMRGAEGYRLRKAYMLDCYYTKEGMEITAGEVAQRLIDFKVNYVDIESNAGGRGFYRMVKRILNTRHRVTGGRGIILHPFYQKKNKVARIKNESANVMENVYMPFDWDERWPAAYEHLTNFQAEGDWDHDDAEDCLTGVAERITNKIVEFGG